MSRPGMLSWIGLVLVAFGASRADAFGPGEAAGSPRPGQAARPRPSRADFVVLVWYRRDKPLETFQYQVYDVRQGEHTAAVDAWVEATPWIEHLAADPASRSNTSVCLRFAADSVGGLDEEGQRALTKRMESLLEAEGAAYDVGAYRDAPPGLRLWCGATVDTEDLEALFPWLDWAFHEARTA